MNSVPTHLPCPFPPPLCRPVWCIEEETFDENDKKRIMCYLGFVYKYMAPGTQPSLDWYMQVCLLGA